MDKVRFIVVIIVFLCLAVWLAATVIYGATRFANCPIQSELVEVIGKRIRNSGSGDSRFGKYSSYNSYIIVFKFPDESVKELQVGRVGKPKRKIGKPNEEVHCAAYDSINVGDTGILTYKEIKNLEERIKTEDMRYDGRRFISFEKDAAHAR